MVCCYTGASGQVYKAYLCTAVGTEIVAVKTVKGANICKSILYVFLSTIHTYVHYLFAIIQCKSISVFFGCVCVCVCVWGGGGGGGGGGLCSFATFVCEKYIIQLV